VGVLLRRP